MKFVLALIAAAAVFGSSSAYEIPNVGTGELAREIQEFLDLLPADDIVYTALQYMAEDPEFQMAVAYMQSYEFQELARQVEEMPEVKNLMFYIYNAGIDIYYLVNGFNAFIGIDPIQMYANARPAISGGVRGFVDDIKALLPMDDLNALYDYKLQNSPVFADFIAQIESPEFQQIVDTVYVNPLFQNLLDKARTAGIDLQAIRELLEVVFGIRIPGRV